MTKKPSKRILSVTIKHTADESPDTSHMGEYSDRAESEYAIDRKHSLDCPVNTGAEGLLWWSTSSGRIELQMTMEQAQSVSHSGPCDEDVAELAKVPAIKAQLDALDAALVSAELKEYGAWDAEELSGHAQNLHMLLWLAGGDISERGGCDCGERGDMESRQYRYFNGCVENYKGESTEDIRKYTRQDYERMERLNRGDWCYIGISAEAKIAIPTGVGSGPGTVYTTQRIQSGGIWGIESDSDRSYLESEEKAQLADLRDQLLALGFSSRAISTAFREVKESQ